MFAQPFYVFKTANSAPLELVELIDIYYLVVKNFYAESV